MFRFLKKSGLKSGLLGIIVIKMIPEPKNFWYNPEVRIIFNPLKIVIIFIHSYFIFVCIGAFFNCLILCIKTYVSNANKAFSIFLNEPKIIFSFFPLNIVNLR